jgi:glycosyltransferase involved in cell wall biosynthesis
MMSPPYFTRRVGIIQRVLAAYRKPFFDSLAATPGFSLAVFAGQPLPDEAIKVAGGLEVAHFYAARNRYWRGPGGPLCWQSGLLGWLRNFDPHVLILEANPRLLSNWLAVRWMKRRRRPVLGWGLGELDRSGPPWYRSFRSMVASTLVRSMDGMIAYSSKARQDYVAAGVPANRVFIAYNAIDNRESDFYLAKFGSDLNWILSWKESLGLDPALPIVLYVGRLIPQKRVGLLIEACAPLLDRCQILIVGDGPLRPELEQQAFPYGNRVRFIGHRIGEELAKWFIASDLFVLPGSGGLAIHQAMSYGKPVIVSFGDGTEADLVREGFNGVFVSPGNVGELRQKIANLLMQPELRQEMGQASLSMVRNEMNLEGMVMAFKRALAAIAHDALETQ